MKPHGIWFAAATTTLMLGPSQATAQQTLAVFTKSLGNPVAKGMRAGPARRFQGGAEGIPGREGDPVEECQLRAALGGRSRQEHAEGQPVAADRRRARRQ